MSLRDAYHPKVKSDLKKLDLPVAREIRDTHIQKILADPFANERLYGDLEGVLSYHFRKGKVQYRIAYTIDESERVVYFLMIGKRESFYDLLKRRAS